MIRCEFATAGRILFGAGRLSEVGSLCRGQGKRALIVVGRNRDRAARLFEILRGEGVEWEVFSIDHEPTVPRVTEGASVARQERCDLVIGFGGGSVLDGAKAIAALATNPGDPLQYLEVVGSGRPLEQGPLPCVAVPTTAGTGAEVTRNAVLLAPQERVKVSLRHPLMLPKVALVDPELCLSLPPAITASTGLDALTQLIEPYVSHRANPLTDGLCKEGMQRAAKSLRHAYDAGADLDARESMAMASLLGGLALANAGLGAVHGFAGPIGGRYQAAHGAVCAALLPHVMIINVRALRAHSSSHRALDRYATVARLLTGDDEATIEDGIAWVINLCTYLQVAPLAAHGVTKSDISGLVDAASRASSMRGNPVDLEFEDLEEILLRALE